MTRLSRRALLQLGGLTATNSLAGRAVGKVAMPPGKPVPAAALLMNPAAYADVTLLDGPMLDQFRSQHATLLAMDENALLKPFRSAAELPAPGDDLGGWYNRAADFNPPANMHGFIPGHSFGQYVSALARAHAITGDVPTRQKVQRLVTGFAATIGTPTKSATTRDFYADYPLPAYTFDKIAIGLIDAHAFAADDQALRVLDRATDAALPHLPEKALTRPEMAGRPHPNMAYTWDESYTLPENLYLAWRRGAGERYRTLAARFLLDKDYFEPLARGENVLAGRHAYSHVNALSSAMQAYLVDGDSRHLHAARNGFDFVLEQSFATGGWGPNEAFVVAGSGALGDSLGTTHASFETPCGAYGHFKVARYLLCATGDSRYGDSMERVLYNTVLGALPMQPDGTAFYYADYNGTGAKTYFEYRCPCCSGTLGQMTADYALSTYFLNARGVVVSLYTPSRLTWRHDSGTVTLQQATAYPLDSTIDISVGIATPQTFSITLRIPAWAGKATALAINGKRVAQPIVAGTFHEIRRTWNDGDRITLELDRQVRLQAVDSKHPNLVAVLQGPLALFAVGDRFLPLTRRDLMSVQQTAARSSQWRITTADGTQSLAPYYAIGPATTTRLYHPV
jgi:uncharacterized protein